MKGQTQRETRLSRIEKRMASLSNASAATSTTRAYRADWVAFSVWCDSLDLQAFPASPQTVARFVADQSGRLAVPTLARRLAAIADFHTRQGVPSPASRKVDPLRSVWRGVCRTKGTSPRRKLPILTAHVHSICDALRHDSHRKSAMRNRRDEALLLVGYCGALRRSELAALSVSDIYWRVDSVEIALCRSKTDPEGRGRKVTLPRLEASPYCPVRSLEVWLDQSQVLSGRLFRSVNRHGQVGVQLSGTSICQVIKRLVRLIGLDDGLYGGHSLRAGLATQASLGGASEDEIALVTGHRSRTVLRAYIRPSSSNLRQASSLLGL